jgi:heme a synthase
MLAACLAAAMTAVVLSLKAPVSAEDAPEGSAVSGAVSA